MDILFPPISARLHFFMSMGRLVKAGVPMGEAAGTIEETGRGRLRILARRSREGLEKGKTLNASLQGGRNLVSPVQLAIIEAGEQTGHLVRALEQLSSMEEDTIARFRKLLGSLMYPLIVMTLSCFMIPVPTLVLGTVKAYLVAVAGKAGMLVGTLALLWAAFRFSALGLSRLLQHLPGPLERALFPERRAVFFHVLETSMQSGLALREALLLASNVWTTADNRKLLDSGVDALDAGETLTAALTPFVDAAHVVLLATGEKSGKMEESFAQLYEIYGARAASRRKLIFILLSVLMSIALLAYVASQLIGGYQQTMEGPMKELEQELNREMRGIWNSN